MCIKSFIKSFNFLMRLAVLELALICNFLSKYMFKYDYGNLRYG